MNNTLILNPPFLLRRRLVFNLKFFWISTIAVLIFLFIFSVFQLNSQTREMYLIQDYEKKISQLSQENKFLEINFSKSDSLKNLTEYIQTNNLERVTKVEYLRVLENTVAAR